MRRTAIVFMVAIGMVVAASTAVGATSADVARIVGTRVSRHHVRVGDVIRFGTAAIDRGSNDYEVDYRFSDSAVALAAERCVGAHGRGPSPDTPFCEYDANTTTTRTVTHTIAVFTVKAGAPRVFPIRVCAASFSTPPVAPDCRVRWFTRS